MKLRCLLGLHVWDLVATHSNCRWMGFESPDHIHLTFYRCALCNKRKATASKNLSFFGSKHAGASTYMQRWRMAGHLPINATGQPRAKLVALPGGKEGG